MLFPPAAVVTVEVNGCPIRAYHRPYAAGGHVFAPLRPFVTRVADRMWYEGDTLVIAREGHEVRIRLRPRTPDALDRTYVPLAAVLRDLGVTVSYESRRFQIHLARTVLATPSPFNAALPSVAPRAVFTPVPAQTPRPIWTGSALPRRTPLPVTVPTPTPHGKVRKCSSLCS